MPMPAAANTLLSTDCWVFKYGRKARGIVLSDDGDDACEIEPEEEPLKLQSDEDPTVKPEELNNKGKGPGNVRETDLNDRGATSDVAAIDLNT